MEDDKQTRVVAWDEEVEADWSPNKPSLTFFVNGAEVVGISLDMGNGQGDKPC